MPGPLANLSAEFSSLTSRAAQILAQMPENAADLGDVVAVCKLHNIEAGDVDYNDDENLHPLTLAEALDARLTYDHTRIRELTARSITADKANGEVARARRDGDQVLNLISIAKANLEHAGFNCDQMGWLAGLDDALAELGQWQNGRRRAVEPDGAWIPSKVTSFRYVGDGYVGDATGQTQHNDGGNPVGVST